MTVMAMVNLLDPGATASVSGRRGQVLVLLQDAAEPMTAAQVAAATGLHINTARFHLEGLAADGRATRSVEARELPGRPRVLYTADGANARPRSYRLLAEMLTGLVDMLADPRAAAGEAGEAWGRHLIERTAPSERVDSDEALGRLGRVLTAIGFEPEVRTDRPAQPEIHLRHCPFKEVAVRHQEVVCALHLGLLRGALAELRAPVEATELEPWVTPTLCVARLRQLP
jgi:predicted ArsR family transcriptional regulator